jgi:hypothetical protein
MRLALNNIELGNALLHRSPVGLSAASLRRRVAPGAIEAQTTNNASTATRNVTLDPAQCANGKCAVHFVIY